MPKSNRKSDIGEDIVTDIYNAQGKLQIVSSSFGGESRLVELACFQPFFISLSVSRITCIPTGT